MKKLIIAAALAFAGVAANAATVQWVLSNFYAPKATAEGSVTALNTSPALNASDVAFKLYVIDYSTGSAGAEYVVDAATTGFTGGKMPSAVDVWTQAEAIDMRDTYGYNNNVYLKLVATYSDANYDYEYVNVMSKSLANITSGAQKYTFSGTKSNAWTATAAAPEPTSGLLLLLGLAGMALKRKHA